MTRITAIRLANYLRSQGLGVRAFRLRLWNQELGRFREIWSVRMDDRAQHEVKPKRPMIFRTRGQPMDAALAHHGIGRPAQVVSQTTQAAMTAKHFGVWCRVSGGPNQQIIGGSEQAGFSAKR